MTLVGRLCLQVDIAAVIANAETEQVEDIDALERV